MPRPKPWLKQIEDGLSIVLRVMVALMAVLTLICGIPFFSARTPSKRRDP